MPDEKDVKDPEKSSVSDHEDDPSNGAGDGDDTSGEGKSNGSPKDVPYSRFKEVNEKAKQHQQVVEWYREHVGDPKDVVEFKKWKQEQLEKANKEKDTGNISPEQLKQFRDLMRKADPEYAEFLDKHKKTAEERMEAQFDDAEEQIRELTKTAGFPTDEKIVARIATHIMDEIRTDEKLMRKWNSGNLSCIKTAFQRYQDEFIAPVRKIAEKKTSELADKRKIARLPSLPSGGSSQTSKASNGKKEERGITKSTHESAWALLQEHMSE